MGKCFRWLALLASVLPHSQAFLHAHETDTQLLLENDKLRVNVSKTTGQMVGLTFEGQDLIGKGRGTYLDCSCTPEGFWDPGKTGTVRLITGQDIDGVPYGGIVMSDTYRTTNQTMEQYTFLREGESGYHTYSRLTYFNESLPVLRQLQEMRTLFRPDTNLWTHIYARPDVWAPLPDKNVLAAGAKAQDATNYLGNVTNDPFVKAYSDFFTKYSFTDQWRNHKAHGMFADGSTSGGVSFGTWVVHNHVDTWHGGPLHSDLMADGILYNYIESGHHGNMRPMIVHGFDRTWGPTYHHFNKGGSLQELAHDAESYANPTWNQNFYDSIAKHVPNAVTSKERTVFKAKINLPAGAVKPIAVLSENRRDFQNNTADWRSRQFWAEVDPSGTVRIPQVTAGTYRLTVYADGIFGWFIQDDVEVKLGCAKPRQYTWQEESAGPGAKEVWRIGTPDKSAGEYRHGYAPSQGKELHPPEHLQYWAQFDFGEDFPNGVHFRVGESDVAKDFNYAHWSVFSDKGNFFRDEPLYDVNNWTVSFDLQASQLQAAAKALFTVQVAGAKTGQPRNEAFIYLPYTLNVNGKDVGTYMIPPEKGGSSCVFRGAVSCHNFDFKLGFEAKELKVGENVFVLSLPFNATSIETAELPWTTYVQYDALRLELL